MVNKKLPLVDLHRHLDGNVRPATIFELGTQHGIALPASTLEDLIPHVCVVEKQPSLVAFLSKMDLSMKVMADEDAIYRLAYENVEDLHLDGIDYAELRFSPYYIGSFNNIATEAVIDAVVAGVTDGLAKFDTKAKLIGIMSRTYGVEACQKELDAILSRKQHFVAIDLAGDELGYPGNLFEPHLKQVQKTDLNVTIHAGEAAGPESIWHALQYLGAQRIGHGVNAAADPKLMDYLATRGIALESCLTSNVQTSTVADISQHPLPDFLARGIRATLNTDDPGIEATTLSEEYRVAANELGLSRQQLDQIQNNGVEAAFLSDNERKQLLEKAKARG